ncbi:DUF1156 domain-containing protein [Paenibacillus alkaliterrae]
MKSWRETCELNRGIPGFVPDHHPAFHDPFAGGGTIPLEAQRLGLESYASDLNPVSVMINKAILEIPPKFAGLPPVNPDASNVIVSATIEGQGIRGLSDDIKYYAQWVRNTAIDRIGKLYPKVELPREYGGGKGTVIAYIWARTVKSPNPAFSHVDVPLVSTFYLSSGKGKEVYIEPVIHNDSYDFTIKYDKPVDPAKVASGTGFLKDDGKKVKASFRCILSGTAIKADYIDEEAKNGRLGFRIMAVAVEGEQRRIYLPPDSVKMEVINEMINSYKSLEYEMGLPTQECRGTFASNAQGRRYGFYQFKDYFTSRQLVTLSTFSDLVKEVREKIIVDANIANFNTDIKPLNDGGSGASAYADAIIVFLSFAIDKMADLGNCLVRWEPVAQCPRQLFGRQGIQMSWGFAESNPLSTSSGSWHTLIEGICRTLNKNFSNVSNSYKGNAVQSDASMQEISNLKIISTDPPYYDNIGYADLSEFFYVWMRRTLRPFFPTIFATISVPKTEELVATPYRHGSKSEADLFFLNGMTNTLENLALNSHKAFPLTIYYAFKQSETNENGTSSTGWETFLQAVMNAGLVITGTWPLRTENGSRLVGQDTNALASSIVLVCRPRLKDAQSISRRAFIRELNELMPEALETMIGGKLESPSVAAVDLQQASIGPGMSVFSKYSAVLEADGSRMTVKTALQLINKVVDAYLNEADGELDSDTMYCLNWFDQYGWNRGDYGQAEVLATAKGTTVDGMKLAGILESGQGKVRLLKWQEYPKEWIPEQDNRTPVWEALHQMIRALQQQGEQVAGALFAGMPARSEAIRNLAYRLYTLCERKGWSDDARAYNELIASWDAIAAAAHDFGHHGTQIELF